MKKACFIFLFTSIISFAKAQYTLTSSNKPVVGDVSISTGLNSSNLHLGSPGPGQLWNYSGISAFAGPMSGTYVAMSSIPNATLYPSGNIGLTYGTGSYAIFSTTANIVSLGQASSTSSNCMVMSNPQSSHPYPFSYGSSFSDTYAYSFSGQNCTGSMTITADGTGTLVLPSGSFNNILRLKAEGTKTFSGSNTSTMITVSYAYYSSVSKMPLLSVESETVITSSGPVINPLAGTANGYFFSGINENGGEFDFKLYPNPAMKHDYVYLNCPQKADIIEISLYNTFGQKIKSFEIKNEISITKKLDISDISSGIYYLRLTGKDKSGIQKIIIE